MWLPVQPELSTVDSVTNVFADVPGELDQQRRRQQNLVVRGLKSVDRVPDVE